MKLKVTAEVISICHRVCSLSFKRDVPTTTNRVKENPKETKHHSPLLSARRTTKAVCHNYDASVYRHPAYTTRQYHPHIRPQSIVTTPSIKFLHPPPPFQFPNERASTSTQSLSGGRHTTATDPPRLQTPHRHQIASATAVASLPSCGLLPTVFATFGSLLRCCVPSPTPSHGHRRLRRGFIERERQTKEKKSKRVSTHSYVDWFGIQ